MRFRQHVTDHAWALVAQRLYCLEHPGQPVEMIVDYALEEARCPECGWTLKAVPDPPPGPPL